MASEKVKNIVGAIVGLAALIGFAEGFGWMINRISQNTVPRQAYANTRQVEPSKKEATVDQSPSFYVPTTEPAISTARTKSGKPVDSVRIGHPNMPLAVPGNAYREFLAFMEARKRKEGESILPAAGSQRNAPARLAVAKTGLHRP
jgi:hypothetical protein